MNDDYANNGAACFRGPYGAWRELQRRKTLVDQSHENLRKYRAANMNDDYYTLEAISNSDLSILAKPNGPQLFKAIKLDKTIKREPTASMTIGNLVHTMTTEPLEVGNRFIVKPEGLDRRTKIGKELYAEMLASGKQVVSIDDWQQAEGCTNALLLHEQIGDLLRAEAMIEKPIMFEWIGVACRCKPDYVNLIADVILDIKTTQSADPTEFAKSIYNYGYHRQAAFYKHAVLTTMGIECRFLFAVVDTNEPYSVACYEPGEEMLKRGHHEVEMLLAEYSQRMESGDWVQEWSKGIVPIELPKWVKA